MRSARQISDREQRQQHGRSDEPVALADDGEDEVGVVFGQEVEHRLGGVVAAPATAPPSRPR